MKETGITTPLVDAWTGLTSRLSACGNTGTVPSTAIAVAKRSIFWFVKTSGTTEQRFLERVLDLHGAHKKITVDRSSANMAAIYRVARPLLGFTTFRCARLLITGVETMHVIRKGQLDAPSSAASPLYSLAF